MASTPTAGSWSREARPRRAPSRIRPSGCGSWRPRKRSAPAWPRRSTMGPRRRWPTPSSRWTSSAGPWKRSRTRCRPNCAPCATSCAASSGDLRGFISQLRPPLLEEQGLDRALERDRRPSWPAVAGRPSSWTLPRSEDLLDEPRQTVVLRVAQEALRNVSKHAARPPRAHHHPLESPRWTVARHAGSWR